MKSIQEIQQDVVEEFSIFEEWLDKYAYLIELGKSLSPYDEKNKTDQFLIQGCQSRVWVSAELIDGKVVYAADSDAIITKGIISLLIRVLSNQSPQDILNAHLIFIDQIGLKDNLSPTRANGLVAMLKQMKLFALAYQTKV